MEWIKIFSGDLEARQQISTDKPQLLVVNGRRICLVLHENKFSAVQDSCTHSGESLSKGHINYLGEVVCAWHGYRFDLQTGRASDSSCRDLITFPIKIDDSGFFIGI